MSKTTLFDTYYQRRKLELLESLLARLRPIYTLAEIEALRIDAIDRQILSQRSGRGFVDRDLLETVLGNLLECVAPGSHNALGSGHQKQDLDQSISEIADQLYAMIAQSLLAAGEEEARDVAAVCERAGVRILRNPPAMGKFAVGETVAIAALRSLVKRRFPVGARPVLDVCVQA